MTAKAKNHVVLATERFQSALPALLKRKDVSGWCSKKTVDVLATLGCARVDKAGVFWESEPVEDADLDSVATCLHAVLLAIAPHQSMNAAAISLLGGLGDFRCWNTLTENIDSANLFAKVLLQYVSTYSPSFILDASVKGSVLSILNEWLKPGIPWVDVPDKNDVCQLMFNGAWCALVLGPASLEFSGPDIDGWYKGTVGRDRPPFLHGLCRGHDSLVTAPGEDLPSFEMSV